MALMNYEWEIENINLDLYEFEVLQQIICKKLANILIQSEGKSCTVWKNFKVSILMTVLWKH